MKKFIICDLDDLLVNSADLHFQAFEEVLKLQGTSLGHLSQAQRDDCYGKRAIEIVDMIYDVIPGLTMGKEEYLEKRNAIFLPLAKTHLKPMPGFDVFISRFKNSFFSKALATSGVREYVDVFLEKFALNDFFNSIVTGSDVNKGKPDPEVYLKTASLLGARPADCVVLEDAPHGIRAAKAAGMVCIAVQNPYLPSPFDLSQANVVVGSLAELTESLIQSL